MTPVRDHGLGTQQQIILRQSHCHIAQVLGKAPHITADKPRMAWWDLLFINSVLQQLRQGCYLAAALTKSKSRYMSAQTHTFHTIYIKQYLPFTSLSPQFKPLKVS